MRNRTIMTRWLAINPAITTWAMDSRFTRSKAYRRVGRLSLGRGVNHDETISCNKLCGLEPSTFDVLSVFCGIELSLYMFFIHAYAPDIH